MLFNSYEFIFLFLPITFILYFYLLSQRLILGAKIFLVVASLFFYGYWNFSYVPLILLSIFVNYGVGLSLVNHEK
ncbi:MBOAT family protein, partial [Aliarcobacter cryaerophilus]